MYDDTTTIFLQFNFRTGMQTAINGDMQVMGRQDESKMTVSFPSVPSMTIFYDF